MKDIKTTIAGVVAAAIIAIEPIVATGNVDWTKVGLAAAVAALGYLAGDKKPNLNP